ncbi:SH3 domain-containing protein [Streptomyces sp. NPDC050619]|uniref:SH3 domain-containing protein n=1 Tax=Streptomyces sp. NPDC050619 TaxID=3157214 RepID=UPI00343C7B51
MSLRSRCAIAVAAAALLGSVATATPAVASDDWGSDSHGNGNHHHHDDDNDPQLFQGVVTARTLALRSAPNRGSQIIRFAHKGEVVSIFCKTGGETVDGNPLWYLLTDGTWAWGPARFIDNIGPAPRWC